MQGRKVYRTDDDNSSLAIGEYAQLRGVWYGCTPGGLLENLGNHQVSEHEDGTITVSPSILVTGGEGDGRWHGYLERGVWREC